MAGKAKLQLLLELKNKLFNNKLVQTQRKLSKTTDRMKGKLKQLKISTVDAFSAMRNEVPLFGRAMDLLGNPYVLITAGLLAMFTLFGKATIEAKKFNYEFLQIRQLNLDKQNKDLKTYKGLIMDSAFETGQGLVDTTKAYYDIQSALGFYGKDAEKVFKSVAKFSTATGAELNDSINSTSKAIKAFGLNANDTDMLLASNAKTVQVGITTFKELAQVQTEYAGAAAGAGQKVDSANKLFAAFTSIAKDSRTAATLTKTAFQGLTQEATVKGLKSIGVELYDAQGNLKDLDGILRQVDGKFKQMSPKQIDELINKIGGPEGLRALFTKLKTGADDLFKTFDAFDSSKFDLDKALKNAQGDVTVLGKMVKSRFNVVMAKLGEKILPLVLRITESLNKAVTWLYDNFDDIVDVVESVGSGFLAAAGYLAYFKIVAIASTISSIGLSGALGLVTFALEAIKIAIFNIPIVGWILLAVTAIVLLYKKVDKFRAVIDGFGATLKEFFSNLWEGSKKVIGGIIDQFKALGKIIGGVLSFNPIQVQEGVNDFKKAFKKSLDGAVEFIPGGSAIKHGKEYAKAFKGAYDQTMKDAKAKKAANQKNKKTEDYNLLDENGNPIVPTKSTTTGDQIKNVSNAASTPKSITIEKIVLNEGGINTQNTTLANKSPEEIEAWFQEAMLRVIRGVELS
jgi:TP901 family phage tail tape measure protein